MPLLDALLTLLFPDACAGCQQRGSLFCPDCQQQLTPYTTPKLTLPPQLVRVEIAYVFEGVLREALHTFKYHRRKRIAVPLGALLAAHLSASWPGGAACTLIGVPLHPQREALRGFNQAHVLAEGVRAATGLPLSQGALVRVRDTRQQATLNAVERRGNMDGAFAWQGTQAPARVMLVDDVVTTGATLTACATALLAAGTREVYGVALARSRGNTATHPGNHAEVRLPA